MSQTFYIFRHGETVGSRRGGFYGFNYFRAPLLEEGLPAIKKMGEYLKASQIATTHTHNAINSLTKPRNNPVITDKAITPMIA